MDRRFSVVNEIPTLKKPIQSQKFRDVITLDKVGFETRDDRILKERQAYSQRTTTTIINRQSQAVFDEFRAQVERNILLGEEEVLRRDQMAFAMGQGQMAISSLNTMQV